MRFITVKYFKSGSSLCPEDFEEKEKNISLNVDLISEYTEPELYKRWGGNISLNYFLIRMNNGIVYICHDSEYKKFITKLIILNEVGDKKSE
jgi:hypothetical protein